MTVHSITAEEYARIVAKVYEPDLDWDTPAEYDLTDRAELTATAEKVLAHLAWSGFVVQRIDDLALDEFDVVSGSAGVEPGTPVTDQPSGILPPVESLMREFGR